MTQILIIEDDYEIADVLQDMLTVENYDVVYAENGHEGVKLAQSHLPDLIICDVMMPELDGYEVLTLLRKNSETGTIPFLFVTAKATRSDQRQGMTLGADDYLTKPFTRSELLSAIYACLEKSDRLHQHSEEQVKANHRAFIRSLPDQINSSLTGILGCTELLMHEHQTMDNEEIQEMLAGIQTSGYSLQKCVKFLLSYAELETSPGSKPSSEQVFSRPK